MLISASDAEPGTGGRAQIMAIFHREKKVETRDFTEQLVFFFFLFIDLGLCNDGEVAYYCLPNVTLVDARYL